MEHIIHISLEFALPKSRISQKVRQNRNNAVYKSNMYFRYYFKILKKLESWIAVILESKLNILSIISLIQPFKATKLDNWLMVYNGLKLSYR